MRPDTGASKIRVREPVGTRATDRDDGNGDTAGVMEAGRVSRRRAPVGAADITDSVDPPLRTPVRIPRLREIMQAFVEHLHGSSARSS